MREFNKAVVVQGFSPAKCKSKGSCYMLTFQDIFIFTYFLGKEVKGKGLVLKCN